MSYTTLYQQTTDTAFTNRIVAAVEQEAWENPTLGDTGYGHAVKNGAVSPLVYFPWPVAVATEDAYAYAVESGNPNPGSDPTVITDEAILAAVQTVWPMEWPTP